MNALIRRMGSVLLAASIALTAGCAAPEPSAPAADGMTAAPAAPSAPGTPASGTRPAPLPQGSSAEGPSVPPKAAPPMSDPLPPERAPDTPIGNAAAVDRSCQSDADCAVKDVGSCCGYQPACVNVASRPDPKAVQAQCARSGMSSVCGFQEIQGCQCVKGQCQAGGGAIR